MPESIKAGDLVIVAFPSSCCGATKYMGHIFKALQIYRDSPIDCNYCGLHIPRDVIINDFPFGFFAERLKKIDPPAEGETERCGTLVLNKNKVHI